MPLRLLRVTCQPEPSRNETIAWVFIEPAVFLRGCVKSTGRQGPVSILPLIMEVWASPPVLAVAFYGGTGVPACTVPR